MPRLVLNALTDRKVQSLKEDGKYADGRGLYLLVKGERRSWLFLYTPKGGKRVELGLGSQRKVTLAQARAKTQKCFDFLGEGKDLRAALVEAETIPTFGKAAGDFLEGMSGQWRNDKHRAQWVMTLTVYAKPLYAKRVNQIATADVLATLKPHWLARPETAQRLQGRIARVIDAAFAHHGLNLPNPARWQGHLQNLLPARQKLTRGHHAAMGVDDLPSFMVALRERQASSVAANALEFTILTASRTGEALARAGMRLTWSRLSGLSQPAA